MLEEYLNELAASPAPSPVVFTGDKNGRYAEVFNWRVFGQQVSVTNFGNVGTFSFWQPSRYDTAIISDRTVLDHGLMVITSAQIVGTNFSATMHVYAGHDYQLQYRDDLIDSPWQNVGSSVAGAGAPIVLTHVNGVSAQRRFYRVRVDP